VSEAERHRSKLPELRFSFGDIATACNQFYRPIFNREMKLLKKRGYLDSTWREAIDTLLGNKSIEERLEKNEAFLLRVGRHSGAESVTLNGVRSIKIMKGKGQNPEWRKEPKTIWLATGDTHDKRRLKPFGWLLVEMTEPDKTLPAWPEAEALMEQYNETMSQWLQTISERKQALAEKIQSMRKKEEQRKREAAKQAEKEAMQKAKAAKQLQEKLATLPADAAELEARRATNKWQDNSIYLNDAKTFLEQKPKYKPRPKELAKQVIKLTGEQSA